MDSNIQSKESSLKIPERKNVAIVFLFSFITMGIYTFFWYIKRVPELNNLRTKTKVKKNLVIFGLIIHILILVLLLTLQFIAGFGDSSIKASDFSDVPLQFTIVLFSVLSFLAIEIIIIILIALKYRRILNEALENKGIWRKVSGFFTFIFNLFYLQYEINRIINDKEMEKRSGPWFWFLLVYIMPLLIVTILLLFMIMGIYKLPF